jgi:REP element-mobilizing transposase RayT
VNVAGGIHHITNRGNRRAKIFRDERDLQAFLWLYGRAVERYQWRCLTFCLLPNHVHLVVETPEPTLSRGMQFLAGRYAQDFNERHGLSGHVFQGRFFARLARSEEHLAQLLRYVALNPSDPLAWHWSAHPVLMSGSSTRLVDAARVEELLEVWGGRHGSRYAALFEPSHWLAGKYGAADPFEFRPPLEELLADGFAGVREALRHGYRGREIAAFLGCSEATVSRRARKGSDPFLAR